jgi:hypothetical protein
MTTTKTIAPAPAMPASKAPEQAVATAKTAVKVITVKASAKNPAATKKPATKPAPRNAAVKKTVAKTPLSKAFANTKTIKTAKSAKTAKEAKTVKVEKPKKPKLVRDSFTIPKLEYVVLEALKQRATKLTRSVKKSELLRAGIKALAALSDAAFLSALDKVPAIKTGRPASSK